MRNTIDNSPENGHPVTDTSPTPAGTAPTLACPEDPTQALAWLPAAALTLTRAYDQLPPPDPAKLRELAVSIAREGLLQPLLVTPSADGRHHEVVAGRRRWLAASTSGRPIPALICRFSPAQKHQAFLAAHVCTATPTSLDAFITAYDATWTTAAGEAMGEAAEVTNLEADSGATEEMTRIAAITTLVEQLSPFGYRHLARELVIKDNTLWDSLLADARQQVHDRETSERQRLVQELAVAHEAVRTAEQHQQHHTQTLTQLGQQVTEARIRYQHCEEQRQEHERAHRAVTAENRHLQTRVAQLCQQIETLRPVEQLAGQPQRADLAQAVMELVMATGPSLLTLALRLLTPRTARQATTALARASMWPKNGCASADNNCWQRPHALRVMRRGTSQRRRRRHDARATPDPGATAADPAGRWRTRTGLTTALWCQYADDQTLDAADDDGRPDGTDARAPPWLAGPGSAGRGTGAAAVAPARPRQTAGG